MLPILLSIGPVKIYAFGVFFFLGLFFGLYWWWKLGRDEHWEEISLFDSFFLSLAAFFLVGRAGYVLLHLDKFVTWYRMLAVTAFPGIWYSVGIAGALAILLIFARNKEWEFWKVADAAAVALSIVLLFAAVGAVFNGSTPGIPVRWGVTFPGDNVARFPADIWTVIWAITTFGLVSRIRKNFRFYAWYKPEKGTVKDGLAALMFVGLAGIYNLVMPWISAEAPRAGIIPVAALAGLLMFVISALEVYRRSRL